MKTLIIIMLVLSINFLKAEDDIFSAYKSQNMDLFRTLVETSDLNKKDEKGNTIILYTCYEGDYENTKLLLNKGANPNIGSDNNYFTPLIVALDRFFVEKMNYSYFQLNLKNYLENKNEYDNIIFVNETKKEANILAFNAIQKYRIAELLIEKGANINYITENSQTPLQLSVLSSMLEFVELLVDNGADLNPKTKDSSTVFDYCYNNEIEKYLLSKGAKKNDRNIFFDAVKNSDISKLKELLKNGFDINKTTINGSNALLVACRFNQIEMAKFLIQNKIKSNVLNAFDKTSMTETIINDGSSQDKIALIDLLLKNGEDIDFKRDGLANPLLLALSNSFYDIADYLISKGANINAVIRTKDFALTNLHYAIWSNDKEKFDYLLKQPTIDLNAVSELHNVKIKNITALLQACDSDYEYFMEKLINAGADLEIQNSAGTTPIIFAAKNNNQNIVRMFLQKKANINHANSGGQTALMLASMYGHLEMAKLLVESGADINLNDVNGYNALQYAKQSGNKKLQDYLIAKGINNKR